MSPLPTLTVGMRTVDRTRLGGTENYLAATLAAFSPADRATIILGYGAADWRYLLNLLAGGNYRLAPVPEATPSANTLALYTLQGALAADPSADYLLFLEDDLAPCADFFGSVRRWLADHPRTQTDPLCTFYTPYVETATHAPAWEYPLLKYYASCAVAIHRSHWPHLLDCLPWLIDWTTGQHFDLLLKVWAQIRCPAVTTVLGAAPDFVDHVGHQSSLGCQEVRRSFSWRGADWTYRGVTDSVRTSGTASTPSTSTRTVQETP